MKVRADQIKQALAKRHWEDFFMTEVKNGPTQSVRHHLKLDALAIKKSWVNPCIMGYEIKVSRSDFLRDDKWPGYLPYCNQFYFVCPPGLIQPEEVPQEVGILYYNPEKDSLTTKRKSIYRLIEEPVDMYKYLIMSRLDNDRHPFFSSNREFIESYMNDKLERKELGRRFGLKVSEEIRELRNQSDTLKRDRERDQGNLERYRKVCDVLREFGIRLNEWGDWEDELRRALTAEANPNMTRVLKRITDAADELKRMIEETAPTK